MMETSAAHDLVYGNFAFRQTVEYPVTEFTPYSALIGGALIGLSATVMMLVSGRVTGISGFLSGLLPPRPDGQTPLRAGFLGGLLLTTVLYVAMLPIEHTTSAGSLTAIIGGLLVGFGTVLGSGCTSGHGVSGIARLSKRSLAATAMFMAAAAITVFVTRHLLGGAL